MTTQLNPYLSFRDNAREAMTFYESVFGGELTISTFADMHASEDPAEQDKVMHAQLLTEDGLCLMGADTPQSMDLPAGSSISLSLNGEDGPTLTNWYDKLADSGNVVMPLEKAPWGDSFGMCVDGFGVSWMVNIIGAGA